jgi:hypothetical protein
MSGPAMSGPVLPSAKSLPVPDNRIRPGHLGGKCAGDGLDLLLVNFKSPHLSTGTRGETLILMC